MAIKSLIKQSEIVTFVSQGILWGDTAFINRLSFNSLRGWRFVISEHQSAINQIRSRVTGLFCFLKVSKACFCELE